MARSIEQMVNQQVLRWLTEQRRNVDVAPASRVREVQQPMITISREFGALGGEMGRILAERLEIGFFAQELVHEVARHAEVRRQVVEALDERTQDSLVHWIDDLFTLRRFTPSDYLRNLSETVLALARARSGVIVGRGGHLLLDQRRTLRVRCYGPIEQRIETIARRDGMSLAEARLKVERVDLERADFYRRHFRIDISSPLGFDLLLNTSQLSIEACVATVASAYRERFSIRPPSLAAHG